ncbi:MAG: nucleoside triphosphate pyrophosphohydrolase [Synergistaceae bacterium]|nr:nucleoside triphosphate pyrophosphohydrolase [Synergistaceae bacterium]
MNQKINESFGKLMDVMKRLRGPGGCPWDKEQTLSDLRTYIVEEAYELVEAISGGRADDIMEECGDVLLQVVFVAAVAEEEKLFSIQDVLAVLTEKLVRRHPHVFAEREAATSIEVLQNWEEIKVIEKAKKKKDISLLGGVPKGLPPLAKAGRIQSKAAHVGFDWKKGELSPLYGKVEEELEEVRQAAKTGKSEEVEEEMGDLFFAAVNLARHLGVNPEAALARANEKFDKRFRRVEGYVAADERPWSTYSADELDGLWNRAKTEISPESSRETEK